MDDLTPETDEAWDAVSRTPDGMYDSKTPMSSYAYAMAGHARKMERERNRALAKIRDLEGPGSNLYKRVITTQSNPLMCKVWDPFPWMVDAFTGGFDDDRYHEIGRWLRDELGPEASPIHEIPGTWHMGGATINGRTWIGFATADMMKTFEEHWKQ